MKIKAKKLYKHLVVYLLAFCLVVAGPLSLTTFALEVGSIPINGMYRLKNVGSGKYMTVHGGNNVDGTNIYQSSKSDTLYQHQAFLFSYNQNSTYRLYALCSSCGVNRCVSIARVDGAVSDGCNVQLYDDVEALAQHLVVESVGPQTVIFRSNSNRDVVVGAYGNSNGSGSGRNATSAGNICMQTYTGSDYQKWVLEPYGIGQTVLEGQYYIKSAYSNLYLTVSGVNVVQKAKTGADTQKWNLIFQDDGTYLLEPVSNAGYRLDVANAADYNGANVGIHPDNGNAAQRYRIPSAGDNTYRIAPQCSTARVLDVCGPSTAENANIQLWSYTNEAQQRWVFEPISFADTYNTFGWSWVFSGYMHTYINSGYQTSRADHTGIDLCDGSIASARILAPTSGTVQAVRNHASAGHMVTLRTNYYDYTTGAPIRVAFYHMVEGSIPLQMGDTVSVGDLIGLVGTSGHSSGEHLHLCIWNEGTSDFASIDTCVNPERFFPRVAFSGDRSDVRP